MSNGENGDLASHLTPQDIHAIKHVLSEEVSDAMQKSLATVLQHEREKNEERIRQIVREERCWCPLNSSQKDALPQAFSMLSDFGQGDYERGICVLRKNHQWTAQTRDSANRYGRTAMVTLIVTVISALVGTILVTIGFSRDLF